MTTYKDTSRRYYRVPAELGPVYEYEGNLVADVMDECVAVECGVRTSEVKPSGKRALAMGPERTECVHAGFSHGVQTPPCVDGRHRDYVVQSSRCFCSYPYGPHTVECLLAGEEA